MFDDFQARFTRLLEKEHARIVRMMADEERRRRDEEPYRLMAADVKNGRGGVRTVDLLDWRRRLLAAQPAIRLQRRGAALRHLLPGAAGRDGRRAADPRDARADLLAAGAADGSNGDHDDRSAWPRRLTVRAELIAQKRERVFCDQGRTGLVRMLVVPQPRLIGRPHRARSCRKECAKQFIDAN